MELTIKKNLLIIDIFLISLYNCIMLLFACNREVIMEEFFKTTNISRRILADICDSFELKEIRNAKCFMLENCEKLIKSVNKISDSEKRGSVINILNSIIRNFLDQGAPIWVYDEEFIKKLFLIRKEGFLHIDGYNTYSGISIAANRVRLLIEGMKKELCKDGKDISKKGKQIDGLIKEFEDVKRINLIKNFNQIFKDYYTIEEIGLENYLQLVQIIKSALDMLEEIVTSNKFNELEEKSKEYLKYIKNIMLEYFFNEENKDRFLDKVLELEQRLDLERNKEINEENKDGLSDIALKSERSSYLEYDKGIVNFFKENFPNEYNKCKEKAEIEKNIKMLLLPCLNRCDKEGYLKKLLEDIKTRGITLKLIEEMYCENKCYIDNEKQEKEAEMSKRKKPSLFAKIFGTKNKVKKEKHKHLIEYSPEAVKKGCINEKIEKFFDKLKKEKLVNEFKINEDGNFIVEFKQQVLPDKNKEEIESGAKKIIELQPKAKESFTERYLRNNESVKENKIEENESERGVKKLVKFFENKKEGEKRCSVRC